MPFQPVTDAALCVVHGAWTNGVPVETILGVKLTSTLDQTLADSITSDIAAAYDAMGSPFSTDLTLNGVTVTDLRTDPAPQFESVAGSFPITGGDSVGALPLQTAALVSWKTALRGKSYRGRSYLPGFCEDESNGRDVGTDLREAIEDWAESLIAASHDFGVISRRTTIGGVPNQLRAAGIITPFTSFTVHGFWATQKRRARVR
jgi:hypothetical protein